MKTLTGCIGIVAVAIFMVVTIGFEYVFIIQTIWNWLLEPVFVIHMTFKGALGIYLFAGMIMFKPDAYEETRNKKDGWEYLAMVYLAPLFSLLLAYIIKVW